MKRNGFIRIETLLALGITGVAGVLLLPALAQNSDTARDRESKLGADCRSNLKQIHICIRQYVQDYDEKYPIISSDQETFGWAKALEPYEESRALFECPSEKHARNDDPREAGYTDYWYNRNFAGINDSRDDWSAAQLLLLGDGDGGYQNSNARYAISALPKSWLTTKGSPAQRHFGGANYAFADGHVKWHSAARGGKDTTFITK